MVRGCSVWKDERWQARSRAGAFAEVSRYCLITCPMRQAFEGTASVPEAAGQFRSRHGLASAVPGHSFITTAVCGMSYRELTENCSSRRTGFMTRWQLRPDLGWNRRGAPAATRDRLLRVFILIHGMRLSN